MVRTAVLPLGLIALMALTLSACSSAPATMRSKMQSWAIANYQDQSYQTDESAISSDLSGIAAGLRLKDLKGLQTDCDGFYDDAGAIYGGLPAPDATVTDDLNEAIEQYWLPGAQACIRSTSLRARGITVFRRDLQHGDLLYATAEKIIHGFGIS